MTLKDKVILIADCQREDGQALARKLSDLKARPVLLRRHGEPLQDGLTAWLDAQGCCYMQAELDMSSKKEIEEVIARIKAAEDFGRIDGLYFNYRTDLIFKRIEELSEEEIGSYIEQNIIAAFLLTQAAGRAISENREGSIVFLGSLNADKPTGIAPLFSMYMGALKNMSREAAVYFGYYNVRVNCLEMGPLGGEDLQFRNDISTFYEGYRYKIPSGYAGSAEDAAEGVLYLMSEKSAYVNGAELRMDGGLLLQYLDPIANYYSATRERRLGNGDAEE